MPAGPAKRASLQLNHEISDKHKLKNIPQKEKKNYSDSEYNGHEHQKRMTKSCKEEITEKQEIHVIESSGGRT